MDWSRIDKEAKQLRKIVLYGKNHEDDNLPLVIPKAPAHLTPLQKKLLEPFGEQFYIAETIRREILRNNVDLFIANLPLSIVVLYTDWGLEAEHLNTLPKYRPQMPPKKVREKTEQELMLEDKAWADRKAIEPSLKRRKVKDQETFHDIPFTIDEIHTFRITPKGFRYVIKWNEFSMVDHTKQLAGLSEARYLVRKFWDKFFTSLFHGFCNLESSFEFARPNPQFFDHDALRDYVEFLKSHNYEPMAEDAVDAEDTEQPMSLQQEIANLMEDYQSDPEEPIPDLPPKRLLAIEAPPTAQDDRYKPDPRESELSDAPSSHDEFNPHSSKKRKRKSVRKKKPQKAPKSHEPTVSNQRPKRKARKSKLSDSVPQDQVVAEVSAEEPTNTRESEDVVEELEEQVAPPSPEIPFEAPSEPESDSSFDQFIESLPSNPHERVCKYLGCGLKFPTGRRMWAHRYGKHKEHLCDTCNKLFTLQKVKKHRKECEAQQQKIRLANTCESCGVVFATNKLKKTHVDKRTVTCTCGSHCSYASRRKRHGSCADFRVDSCPTVSTFHIFRQ